MCAQRGTDGIARGRETGRRSKNQRGTEHRPPSSHQTSSGAGEKNNKKNSWKPTGEKHQEKGQPSSRSGQDIHPTEPPCPGKGTPEGIAKRASRHPQKPAREPTNRNVPKAPHKNHGKEMWYQTIPVHQGKVFVDGVSGKWETKRMHRGRGGVQCNSRFNTRLMKNTNTWNNGPHCKAARSRKNTKGGQRKPNLTEKTGARLKWSFNTPGVGGGGKEVN